MLDRTALGDSDNRTMCELPSDNVSEDSPASYEMRAHLLDVIRRVFAVPAHLL